MHILTVLDFIEQADKKSALRVLIVKNAIKQTTEELLVAQSMSIEMKLQI